MSLYHSIVISKKYFSSTRCLIEFSKPRGFNFKPGQFISLKVSERVFRSYSLINKTLQDNSLFIYVDLNPNGVGSKFINSLKNEDEIIFSGPFGSLSLPSNLNGHSYNFIATGAGISPFISMINSINSVKVSSVFLLYSEKYTDDFFPIESWITNTGFTVLKTVTRENVGDKFFSGRVTKYMNYLFFNTNSYFYICGNSYMIKEVSENLKKEYKVSKSKIIVESFY